MMTVDKLENRLGIIKKFLDNNFICEDIFIDDLPEYMEDEGMDDDDVSFHAGLTKGCIDYKDLPYVIKCGLDGWCNDYRDDVYFDENPVMDELQLYEEFKKAELEKILAKTWKLDDTFICAEKVIPICNYWEKESHEETELTEKEKEWINNHQKYFRLSWIEKTVKVYGIDYMEKFINMAENYGFLDDMHSGNYGYTEDGTPKILDFGGTSSVDQINSY